MFVPVINMKTEEGVRQFEAIAKDVAELVLEYGVVRSRENMATGWCAALSCGRCSATLCMKRSAR